MRRGNGSVRHVVSVLAAAGLLAAIATSASAQDIRKRFMKGAPLVIEDQGSFFIGGVPKVTNYNSTADTLPGLGRVPAQITIGQMYVQFQIPAKKRESPLGGRTWPVIMVHGSTHTGACLEATPDGREGWLPYFLQKGISSYVVDQSGRGRSGFDQSVIHEAEARIDSGDAAGAKRLLPSFGRISDSRAWLIWFGHLVPPGSTILTGRLIRHGDPGDPPTDDSLHADNYRPAYPIPPVPNSVDPSIVARRGAIGPAPEGPDQYYALNYYKQLVPNAEVTLPTSRCPTCVPDSLTAANTWTPRNLATLVEKLGGAIVVTHSQSGIMGHHMARILKEDHKLNLLKGLITIEGSCSFAASGITAADFDQIPYMALKGDYTATSRVCADSAVGAINARRAAGQGSARADYIQLDDPKYGGAYNGTTHMMMLGTNNLKVADVILGWVDKWVPGKRTR